MIPHSEDRFSMMLKAKAESSGHQLRKWVVGR
jgi:hypothetical protein